MDVDAGGVGGSESPDLLDTYLTGLRDRLGARGFEAVVRAADATCVLLAEGHHAVLAGPDGRDGRVDAGFDADLQREYLTLLAVLITGRTDHRVVRLPGLDGLPGWAVLETEPTEDPAVLEVLCRQIEARAREGARTAIALENLWDT
ncbi:hypothetical protein KPP03845_100029 [Streptomyces xanthophaeus]|uniref:hypothetical protein n=1 Tax=Streptomyces xanthophaeus TaxID=67385 RepID=UPI00233F4761|nr:hypothetical protein [Streptomyces xanthophaeus]WCD83710.1 hypothetical protein KPP03845_100029 [Streptomyces xanthophaeus]